MLKQQDAETTLETIAVDDNQCGPKHAAKWWPQVNKEEKIMCKWRVERGGAIRNVTCPHCLSSPGKSRERWNISKIRKRKINCPRTNQWKTQTRKTRTKLVDCHRKKMKKKKQQRSLTTMHTAQTQFSASQPLSSSLKFFWTKSLIAGQSKNRDIQTIINNHHSQ